MSTEALIQDHLTALAAAESPIDRLMRVTSQVLARMLDEAGEVADVVQSHRETLLAAQIEALSAGKIEMAHKALDTFVNAVRHSLLWERTNGRLRQYTSFDRVNAWKSELAAHLYGAAAKSTLVDYLVSADEEIAAVDFYAVTLTNGRVITRQDIRDACRTELLTGLESDEKVRAAADAPPPRKMSLGDGSGIVGRDGVFRPFHEEAA